MNQTEAHDAARRFLSLRDPETWIETPIVDILAAYIAEDPPITEPNPDERRPEPAASVQNDLDALNDAIDTAAREVVDCWEAEGAVFMPQFMPQAIKKLAVAFHALDVFRFNMNLDPPAATPGPALQDPEPAGPDSFGGEDFPSDDSVYMRRPSIADYTRPELTPASHEPEARRCDRCGIMFAGPAFLTPKNTFCSLKCQTAEFYDPK